MKTFIEHIELTSVTEADMQILTESLQTEWTPELESKIDEAVESFLKEYQLEDGSYDINMFNDEITNEGILGSIVGGLGGFALGKSVGKIIAKVLGIEKGVFYDLLTSRLVGAALGSALGKKF
tara:strand:+ start:2831 stop:3199 length:369 start_codon:yes stop_codon:yes gene_type:complete